MKINLATGVLAAVLLLVSMVGMAGATAIQWTTDSGGNGHWYDVITTESTISWEQARVDASSVDGWHLVTLTSAAEDSFVFSLLTDQQTTVSRNYWLGGYQPDGSTNEVDPAAGWSWVTGEEWSFTNWVTGEPNNGMGGTQHYLHYWPTNQWDDMDNRSNMVGYVVETAPVPEPATLLLLGVGLAGLAGYRRKTRK